MIRCGLAVTSLVCALALAGCGGPGGSSGNGLHGWLAQSANGTVFLQWTRDGNSATGTLSQAYYDESDPTTLKTENLDFTGTISGGDVTLAFGSGATSWQGTLKGDTLLLSYALSDGTLTTLTFNSGSVDDYNTAVAAVRSATDTATHQKAVARAQADAAQAVKDDSVAVANAIRDVLSQANSLSTSNFADIVQSAQSDLANTKSDLAQLRSDEPLLRCGDSGVVQGDVGAIEGDQGALEGDGGVLDSELSGLADAVTTLNQAWRGYTLAVGSAPSAVPSDAPSASKVVGARATAATARLRARQIQASAVASLKQILSTANGYAAQADAACNASG